MSHTNHFRITTMGRFWVEGVSEDHFARLRPQMRALLALTCTNPGGIEKESLVEVLWPDSPQSRAYNRLYNTISCTRAWMCEAFSRSVDWPKVIDGRVCLSPEFRIDTFELSDAARAPYQLEVDVILDLVSRSAHRWMDGENFGLPGRRVQAQITSWRNRLIAEILGRYNESDTHTQALIHSKLDQVWSLDPSLEALTHKLMCTEMSFGRYLAVLKRFDRFQRESAQRLGMRPSARTERMADQALRLVAKERSKHRHTARLGNFYRPHLLSRVGNLLSGERSVVFNITGPCGSGKTELLRDFCTHYRGPCTTWLDCLSDALCPDAVEAQLLRYLDSSQDSCAFASHEAKSERNLLVIDHVDSLADTSRICTLIDEVSNRAHVILISRAAVRAGQYVTWQMPWLSTSIPGKDESLHDESEGALFFKHIERQAGLKENVLSGQLWLDEVVRKLGGHPVALIAAAHRSTLVTPAELLRDIDQAPHRLETRLQEAELRHRSLEACLDQDISKLTPCGRLLFEQIASFDRPFLPEDVIRLQTESGTNDSTFDLYSALDGLVDSGHLHRTEDKQFFLMAPAFRCFGRDAASARTSLLP